jgi:hypothetical protein
MFSVFILLQFFAFGGRYARQSQDVELFRRPDTSLTILTNPTMISGKAHRRIAIDNTYGIGILLLKTSYIGTYVSKWRNANMRLYMVLDPF